MILEMHLVHRMVALDIETTCAAVQAEVVVNLQCSVVKEHVMVWASISSGDISVTGFGSPRAPSAMVQDRLP